MNRTTTTTTQWFTNDRIVRVQSTSGAGVVAALIATPDKRTATRKHIKYIKWFRQTQYVELYYIEWNYINICIYF